MSRSRAILPVATTGNSSWPKYTPLQASADIDDRSYRNGKPPFTNGQINGLKSNNLLLNSNASSATSKLLFV